MFLSGDGQRDVAVSPRAPTARPPTGYCLVLLGLQVTAVIFRLWESSKYIDVLSDKQQTMFKELLELNTFYVKLKPVP